MSCTKCIRELKPLTYYWVILFFDNYLFNHPLIKSWDFFKANWLESKINTLRLATRLATIAIPVPIWPDPTTPKDLTWVCWEKNLLITEVSMIMNLYATRNLIFWRNILSIIQSKIICDIILIKIFLLDLLNVIILGIMFLILEWFYLYY